METKSCVNHIIMPYALDHQIFICYIWIISRASETNKLDVAKWWWAANRIPNQFKKKGWILCLIVVCGAGYKFRAIHFPECPGGYRLRDMHRDQGLNTQPWRSNRTYIFIQCPNDTFIIWWNLLHFRPTTIPAFCFSFFPSLLSVSLSSPQFFSLHFLPWSNFQFPNQQASFPSYSIF